MIKLFDEIDCAHAARAEAEEMKLKIKFEAGKEDKDKSQVDCDCTTRWEAGHEEIADRESTRECRRSRDAPVSL